MSEQCDPNPDPGLGVENSSRKTAPTRQLPSKKVWQRLPLRRMWYRHLGVVDTALTSFQQKIVELFRRFRVDEAELAEILAKVRAELPMTEVLLVGKPQTGKSSIIRGLTGVGSEIIGQGFRPHTAYTQRYYYPTDGLPLLSFTDTVGLAAGTQQIPAVIQALNGELQPPAEGSIARAAKALVLTVKINDFATDSLRQIVQQIRRQHPEIPCLLAVTCLHEIYPAAIADHPTYPPSYEGLTRAFAELQKQFAPLYDRAVLIDFTQETDGYRPVFYGLDALVAALADLLPEAEARVMHQLLPQAEAGLQIDKLYREAGRRYIVPFAVMAGTLAAVPLPLATMPALTALQVTLVGLLGQLYGQVLTPSQAGGVASAIAGGFVAQLVGRELVKVIPGFGSVVAASWAAAYTWALGEGACVYFGDLLGGKQPDPQKIKQVMDQAFKDAQARFKDAVWVPVKPKA